jgi:hypothetical protein
VAWVLQTPLGMRDGLRGEDLALLAQEPAGTPRANGLAPGERALMLAVLEDGIRCFLGMVHYDRTNPQILARQAEYWLRLDDWESPFSFNNICEALGLDFAMTRATILDWKNTSKEILESHIRLLHIEAAGNGRTSG